MKKTILPLLIGLCLPLAACAAAKPHKLMVADGQFQVHNKPFVIRSGEIHYPRIPRSYWRDRLKMAKAMGLNTITTYVFWNVHEKTEGTFNFSGQNDLKAFLKIAQEEGLYVLLRPGPYICTEWDFGGFPSWLLKDPKTKVRSQDPRFMSAAGKYIQRVADEVRELQSTRGGPILMVQVENEYGSYPNEPGYLEAVHQQYKAAGFEVPLFTSDGPGAQLLKNGTLPGVAPVVNFYAGKGFEEHIKALQTFRPGTPNMVGEWWNGWFDHWGRPHHTSDPKNEAEGVAELLKQNISFNLYMFHGGTNFGFTAGANWDGGRYWPDTTSYDYDAPLDEAGRPTAKFHAYREVIAAHLKGKEKLPAIPAAPATQALPAIQFSEQASLADLLQQSVSMEQPTYMEALGQDYGFVLYRHLPEKSASDVLDIDDARDFVSVWHRGERAGVLDRRLKQRSLDVRLSAGEPLDLLVEAMGRINFAAKMPEERKGLLNPVTLNGRPLKNWQIFSLPMSDLSALKFSSTPVKGPVFYRAKFVADKTASTFLDLSAWKKGVVWVNGKNLGRFWEIGPQKSLYLPGDWLKEGENEIVVFESMGTPAQSVRGTENPLW